MSPAGRELSVVLPAYNEEAAIADVVLAWVKELDGLGIDYELRVYDDGSTDQTAAVLAQLASERPRLVVTGQANRGHGPTILRGYREAQGDWIFQADGDGEIPASAFGPLWECRNAYDLLLGYRQDRRAELARRLVTRAARLAVRLFFGATLRDVNSPYRLMRRRWLHSVLPQLPEDTFAPNVILAGLAARGNLRILEQAVPYHGRTAGTGSLVRGKLWRGAFRALVQTVAAATSGPRGRAR